MLWKSFLRRASSVKPSRTKRFAFETLEDRTLLTTVTWTGLAGTLNWNDALNWSNTNLPGPGDDVVIDAPGITISHGSGSNSVLSLVSNAALALTGGVLSIAANSTIGDFNLAGGSFSGSAQLTVTSELLWTGGSVFGTGKVAIAPGGTGVVSGTGNKFLSGTLENAGTLTLDGTGNFYFGLNQNDPGILNNLPGGVVTMVGESDIAQNYPNANHAVNNQGTFRHTGVGTSVVAVPFHSNGTVAVLDGVLSLNGGGTIATLAITEGTVSLGGGTFTMLNGGSGSGAGMLAITGATVTVAENATASVPNLVLTGGELTGAGTLNVTNQLTWNGGYKSGASTVVVQGNMTWTSGSSAGTGKVAIAAGGTGAVSGTGNKFLSGMLENAGTLTLDGTGNFYFGLNQNDPGILNNLPGGVVTMVGESDIAQNYPNANHAVNNQGTFRHTGVGTSVVAVPFHSNGTVAVLDGVLSLNGGGTIGSITVSEGTVSLSGGTFTVLSGGSGSGAGTVAISGAVVTIPDSATVSVPNLALLGGELTGGGTLHVTGEFNWAGGSRTGAGSVVVQGHMTWSSGLAAGTGKVALASGGTGLVSGNANKFLSGTLENVGSLTIDGSGFYFGANASEPGILNNLPGGVVTMVGESDISQNWLNANHAINNQGTFRHTGAGTSSIGVPFTSSSGTIEVQPGGALVPPADSSFTGTIILSPGSALTGRNVVIDGNNRFDATVNSQLQLTGSFTGTTTNADQFRADGAVSFTGGTAQNPLLLEVMGQDLGVTDAGFRRNFAHGLIQLNSASVKLVDNANNAFGTSAEALYVDTLIVPGNSTLDLNGLKVYVRVAQVSGSIINGTYMTVSDSTAVPLDSSTSGTLSSPAEEDEWSFFARTGQGVTLFVNPGDVNSPPPAQPRLNYANVELIDPAGNVIASASNTVLGQTVRLAGLTLPADGVYKIRIKAPDAQPNAQGNYLLSLYNSTIDERPLILGQRETGELESAYSIDRWTFSAAAGQQIRLNVLAANGLLPRFITPASIVVTRAALENPRNFRNNSFV